MAKQCTKYEVFSFSRSGDTLGGIKELNGSRDHIHTHFGGDFWTRSAKLPTGLSILLALILLIFFFNDFLETYYLTICWTDFRNLFTKWKRFGCKTADDRSWPPFSISKGTLPWQPILGKNGKLPTFVSLAFRNGMGYRKLNVHVRAQMMPGTTWPKKLAYFVEYLPI